MSTVLGDGSGWLRWPACKLLRWLPAAGWSNILGIHLCRSLAKVRESSWRELQHPPPLSTAKDCAPALCHRCRTMGAACYWLVLPSSLQASVLVTDLLRHWWVTRAKVLLKLAAEVGLGLTGGRCRAGSGAVPCSQTSTLSMRRASLFHYTNRSHTYTIKSLRQALEPHPSFFATVHGFSLPTPPSTGSTPKPKPSQSLARGAEHTRENRGNCVLVCAGWRQRFVNPASSLRSMLFR